MGPPWLWLLETGILASVCCQPFPAHGDKSLGVPQAPRDQLSEPAPAYHKVTPAITHFALRLYKQLAAETPGNIFFSPVSISSTLALLSLGAQGDTPTQILEGLGFNLTETPEADIHRGFQSLIHTLNRPSPKHELKVGNSLFLDRQLKPRQHFLDAIRERYGAFAFSANFTDSATTGRQINDYVRKQTYGQVVDCLQEFTRDTLMVLVNYVFLKGERRLRQNCRPLLALQPRPKGAAREGSELFLLGVTAVYLYSVLTLLLLDLSIFGFSYQVFLILFYSIFFGYAVNLIFLLIIYF